MLYLSEISESAAARLERISIIGRKARIIVRILASIAEASAKAHLESIKENVRSYHVAAVIKRVV